MALLTKTLTMVIITVLSTAAASGELPSVYLHLSFDRGFHIDGTGTQTLTQFPNSKYPGIAELPAGRFVPGLNRKGFIPDERLLIQGEKVMPAPEGTISMWIKPVNHQEDWVDGPQLSSGRIGPFLRTTMHTEDMSANIVLTVRNGDMYDYANAIYWVEQWPDSTQNFRETGPNIPFRIWQADDWRMITVVWCRGERRIYIDDILVQHGRDTSINPTRWGRSVEIPAGSKLVDELSIWNIPLSTSEVAALFYSHRTETRASQWVQTVPKLSRAPGVDGSNVDEPWQDAMETSTWVEGSAGTASEDDSLLQLGHKDGNLYLRYRQPMPEDYVAAATTLGGTMLRHSVFERDGNVWADDAVELRLTPDNGSTNYVFAVSASGARYDAKNGDTTFDLDDWQVWQQADANFWTVEMRLNLLKLTEGQLKKELGFNFVRTVRHQGFARRQWSFRPGDPMSYARMKMADESDALLVPEMKWQGTQGKLQISVRGATEAPVKVEYTVEPLHHSLLFPDDKDINRVASQVNQDKIVPAYRGEHVLTGREGSIDWQREVDYVNEGAAVASVTVKDTDNAMLASRSFLISGKSSVGMTLLNLPSADKVLVDLRLASETLAGPDVRAEVTLTPEGYDEPRSSACAQGFSGISKQIEFDVSKIPTGPYDIRAKVTRDGNLLGLAQGKGFRSGKPVWADNDIGIINSVPAPWTPVEAVNNSTLRVWGRDYQFNRSLLPSSVRVLDEEILAGPMRILATGGSGQIDIVSADTPAMRLDEAGVIAEISGIAKHDALLVEMEGEVEFDGFGLFTFTLKPSSPGVSVGVDSLVLEVPFKKKYAKLYDDSSYDMFTTNSGDLPAQGITYAAPSAVRVGDASRGLQFWPFPGQIGERRTSTPLLFTPEDDSMVMRYTISEGMKLDKPVTFQVGLIGTPVKPFDAVRIRKTAHTGVALTDDLIKKGYARAEYWNAGWSAFFTSHEDAYYNYTPTWIEQFVTTQQKKMWDERREYRLLYMTPGTIEPNTPEYAYYQDEWRVMPQTPHMDLNEYIIDLAGYEGADTRPEYKRWVYACWANRSYQDFFFYSLDKILAEHARQGVRVGLYFDQTMRWSCANPYHGHGTQDEHGGIHVTQSDVKGFRRWAQRLYQVMRKHSPDGLIAIHMSGDRIMPIWGMADVLVEGEQYLYRWKAHMANHPELTFNDAYPHTLPLDRVRATYARTLWGPQQVFLDMFWTDERQGEDVFREKNPGRRSPTANRRVRHIAGLMRAHDVPLWGEFKWISSEDEKNIWVRMARWGFDEDVKFIPYWDNQGMIGLEGENSQNVVASGWYRPDGELMVMVLNDTDADVSAILRVNADKFPVKLKRFAKVVDISSPDPVLEPDMEESAVYTCTGGKVEVQLRPRDYRLLVFEQEN